MSFVQKGIFRNVEPERNPAPNFFTQQFSITVDNPYDPIMIFQANQERRDILLSLKQNDQIEVTFNIKQRQGKEGNYFTTLEMWKIQKIVYHKVEAQPLTLVERMVEAPAKPATETAIVENENIDLPF